jgi:hypothetical protein
MKFFLVLLFCLCFGGLLHAQTTTPKLLWEGNSTKEKTKPKPRSKTTLFNRYGDRSMACPSGNPALCSSGVVDMSSVPTKKIYKMELENNDQVSNTFCLGMCRQNAGFRWSLEWQ